LKKSKKHPKYNITNATVDGYDIMLFILDQPIDPFTREIQPACLPFNQSPKDYPPLNSTNLIAGWGLTNGTDKNSYPNDLQNALNRVVDCSEYNLNTRIICSST
jgi:hypothetical protein